MKRGVFVLSESKVDLEKNMKVSLGGEFGFLPAWDVEEWAITWWTVGSLIRYEERVGEIRWHRERTRDGLNLKAECWDGNNEMEEYWMKSIIEGGNLLSSTRMWKVNRVGMVRMPAHGAGIPVFGGVSYISLQIGPRRETNEQHYKYITIAQSLKVDIFGIYTY